MYDLFLDQKVLDYNADRYELILFTLRWARTLKGKGSPEPMQALIEKALKDIVEGRITKEEILKTKPAEAPIVAEEVPAVVSLADVEAPLKLPPDDDEDKKSKKGKKKKDE
jgi:hypothetical protein